MAYSDKVIDHYNNPRNVGSLDKQDPNVGTGLVGAPECGDVMKLQIEFRVQIKHECSNCHDTWFADSQEITCPHCNSNRISITLGLAKIVDSKFKTFGCGSAIASSSLATEWLKGRTIDEALAIKNTEIVRELSLPPVKIHCSVLAEDAIKAAIRDYQKKQKNKSKE